MRSFHPDERAVWLLQAALNRGPDAVQSFRRWSRSLDFDTLDVASQRVLPLLVANPRLRDEVGLDDPVLQRCSRVARFTWLKTRLLVSEASPAVVALRAAGIPVLLLKGAAVVSHTAGNLADRPMDDIDLAVPAARAVSALRLLGGLGFHPPGRVPDAAELARWIRFDHGMELRNAKGAAIDLHWHVSGLALTGRADRPCWDAAVPGRLGLESCPTTSIAHTIVGVLGHAMAGPGTGLRWATDAVALSRAAPGSRPDWEAVAELAARQRISVGIGTALETLHRMVDLEVPPAVRRLRLAPRPAQQLERRAARTPRPSGPPRRHSTVNAAYLEHARRTGAAVPPVSFAAGWVARGPRREVFPVLDAGDEVRFDLGGRGHHHLGRGWAQPEDHGTWSRAREATFGAELPWAGGRPVRLFLRLVPFLPPLRPSLTVRLAVGGRAAAQWTFTGPGWQPAERSVTLDGSRVARGLRARLRFDYPVSPDATGPESGARALAVSLNSLRIDLL